VWYYPTLVDPEVAHVPCTRRYDPDDADVEEEEERRPAYGEPRGISMRGGG
jgi:hypothetical protein